jgi:hypothetical protein
MRDERLEVSVSFDERRGYVAGSACRATGPLPRPLARGRSIIDDFLIERRRG